jgi:hypothetical protein
MGLEARCRCRWDGGSGAVRALLEADALILRGDLKRRFPIAEMSDVRANGAELHFRHSADAFALELGAGRASRWAEKIAAPPSSLAKKLGVAEGSKVRVIGPLDDAVLQEALKDATAARGEESRLSLAVVRDAVALRSALSLHESQAAETPIWIVHEKGRKAAFGEGPVRSFMRGAGYLDNKVCAVSEALSATRYGRVAASKPDR